MKIQTNKKLDRNLGFFPVFAIGTGTMIGAGIFVLPGIAITNAGPGAIISFLVGGLIALVTALSMAELATGMPRAGGTYYFISRAMGPVIGNVIGIGAWLALTFKGSFALVGLAEYSQAFINLPILLIAIFSGLILIYINYRGAENSGSLQNAIVVLLFVILILFIILGIKNMNVFHLNPILPYGVNSIFTTTGLIFVSYLGITQLAAISEEVKEPAKNLPKAFIFSVLTVTILYLGIMLVVNGMLPLEKLAGNETPLIVVSEMLAGSMGRIIIVFAGFFATVSTANAAILSSSRFPFAMARDNLLPDNFVNIHKKHGTPTRSILFTGGVMILFLIFFNVEQLAKLGSTFNVMIFALINLATIILRNNNKEWYKPSFRDPLFPYSQIFGIIASLSLIPQLGMVSFLFAIGVIICGIIWYMLYAKDKAKPEYGFFDIIDEDVIRLDTDPGENRVMVSIASSKHMNSLLKLANIVGDKIIALHVFKIPSQTGLSEAKETEFIKKEESDIQHCLKEQIKNDNTHKYIEVLSHNVPSTILNQAEKEQIDLLIMGWHEGKGLKKYFDDISYKVMSNARNHLAILKGNFPENLSEIIIPFGGGESSNYAIYVAKQITKHIDVKIKLIRVISPDLSLNDKKIIKKELVKKTNEVKNYNIDYKIKERFSVIDTIIEESSKTDFMILGDSNKRFKRYIIGNLSSKIVNYSKCPVLLVKRYRPISKRGIKSLLYNKFLNKKEVNK